MSPCVLFDGHINRAGYGLVCIHENGKYIRLRAHRVAFQYYTGVNPGPLMVCHRCDVRSCIAPDHLFLGTLQDNCADMVSKDRQWRKLKTSDVLEVRRLLGNDTLTAIAKRFGVARYTIVQIRDGITWAHV